MTEPLNKFIAMAVSRPRLTEPIDISTSQSLGAIVGASLIDDKDIATVQIGIEPDILVVVDPKTSEIISTKRKDEAYKQIVDTVSADVEHKRKLFDQNLLTSRQYAKFSLVAAGIGFLVVLGGVIAMISGYSSAAVITSATGVISEIVALLFFRQARIQSRRLDSTLDRLLDVEGYYKAFVVAEQLTDEKLRDRLIEVIVMRMIGFSSGPDS